MAETLYLDPNARLHHISDDIPAVTATIAHSLADGWTWAVEVPRLRPGENVLILGPGPRGLACLLAAKSAGAGWVGISGLDVDSDRLEMARLLGADLTVNVSTDDLEAAVGNSLGQRPDLVVDVTSNDPEAIYVALEIVRPGRTGDTRLDQGRATHLLALLGRDRHQAATGGGGYWGHPGRGSSGESGNWGRIPASTRWSAISSLWTSPTWPLPPQPAGWDMRS